MARVPLEEMTKLPKSRRDFLEVFGNQWGRRESEPAEVQMSAEERESLAAALNPFAEAR